MAQRRKATQNEVLKFYTDLLRMEGGAKLSEAIKAAEFFVKYYGMLDKEGADESKRVVIVDDVPKCEEQGR
ncbi:MAG: hypothetical protein UH081_01990 [Clostridia bacterium]|nr:hypothetical protein [Clostridia bacterium]